MADYYMCYPGEVMEAALPSVFKISSESVFQLNSSYEGTYEELKPEDLKILDVLHSKPSLSVKETCGILGEKKRFSYP